MNRIYTYLTAITLAVLFTGTANALPDKPTRDQRRSNPQEVIEARAALEALLGHEDREAFASQIRLALAEKYAKEKNILKWGKMLFPDKFPIGFCPLHEYLVDIRGERFANTQAPRFHAKTTIQCFLIPIFQALEEPETFRHYLNIQSNGTKAAGVNVAIRSELETNELLQQMYGYQVGRDKWTDAQFVLQNGVIFTALGAGQSIRGINYRNIRPEYIVCDDLYDEDHYNNQEATTKINNWFWGALYPARAVARRWAIRVQGTAVNEFDLMKALEDDPNVVSKTFRQIEGYGTDNPAVLWPELNTLDEALADKGHMGILWFREMQNERQDSTESKVKPGALKIYDPAELKFDANHILVSVELGVDPSIGAKPGADATGIALILKTRFKDAEPHVFNYYIMDLWEERLSMNKRIELLVKISEQARAQGFRIRKAHIEGISGFQDFVSEVKRRTNLPVHLVAKVKDKLTNLENKSVYFENGRVYISKRITKQKRDAFEYQLTTNKPKNDDMRDSVLLVLPELQIKDRFRFI